MKTFDEDGNYIEPKYPIKNGKEYDKFISLWDRLDHILDKIFGDTLPRDKKALTKEEFDLVNQCNAILDDLRWSISQYNYHISASATIGKDKEFSKKQHKELVRKGIYTH